MTCNDDYHEAIRNTYYAYFEAVKSGVKFEPQIRRISPSMYKRALEDFMLFGRITRYPERYIFKWKRDVLSNIALLSAFTDIYGHSPCCPFDEFNDVFFYNQETGIVDREVYDYSEYSNILEEHNETPVFWSNGQYFLSDYGLPQLEKLAVELISTSDVNQILVLINKILDVTHPRSDIAELFIDGGSDSLTSISA